MTHSILSPSSAHIWGKPDGCTGYVTMSQMFKKTESYAANEGSAAHELCQIMLKDWYFKLPSDMFSSNGILFDEEMYESGKIYCENVYAMLSRNQCTLDDLKIEQKIECKSINYLSFGTVDAYFYSEKNKILYLWDYKYGHITVDPFENWQLINYAAGLVQKLKLTYKSTINFRIVQPRSYHRDGPIRHWTITVEDLIPYFNQLHDAAIEALCCRAEDLNYPAELQ